MKRKHILNKSQTDWARVDAMEEKDLDLSDSPEITPEMFARGVLRRGLRPVPRKSLLTVRLDEDLLAWFRSQGRGYQTRINALLRAYMVARAHQLGIREPPRVRESDDLLRLGSLESAFRKLGARPLQRRNHWDALVLAEAALLQKWAGVNATLVHRPGRGTAAASCGLVTIDRDQLDALFTGFVGEQYKTAIFFALSHEFGHLCQFRHFGIQRTFEKPRMLIEAHADLIAGVWLGFRLTKGADHAAEVVMRAGLQLKSGNPDYPSDYQRGRLVQEGLGQSALLVSVLEPRILGKGYQPLAKGLSRGDVFDLYGVAHRLLEEVPVKPLDQARAVGA